MTVLSLPTILNQLTAGGQYPGKDCGETVVISVLADWGHPQPMRAIEGEELKHGNNPSMGTYAETIVSVLGDNGVPAVMITAAMRESAVAALGRNHRLLWVINSDGWGNPAAAGHGTHWLEVYGYDGSRYYVMNSLGGRLVSYEAKEIEPISLSVGVEVLAVMPKDIPPAAAPTTSQEDQQPMTPGEKHDLAVSLYKLYMKLTGGTPDQAQAEYVASVAQLPDSPFEHVADRLITGK